MRKSLLTMAALLGVSLFGVHAQDLKIKGVAQTNRYDDGDQMHLQYIAWNSELGRGISTSDYGTWTMTWNGLTLSSPVKEPNYPISSFYSGGKFTNNEVAEIVTNQLMMAGNSGAAYLDGHLITVFSRDESSTVDEELFRLCKWDAATGKLLKNEIRPKSDCLESAGMSYNPIDGKVYGLFYLTNQQLSEEFTGDPEFFVDEDGESSSEDAGYCLCSVDPLTMDITPITPGLYYYNFVTFAINSEGRAFALTSGGSSAPEAADGKVYDINNRRAGAQLCEFDVTTGLMKTKPVEAIDPETNEPYTEYVNIYDEGTGYCSQYRRQSACFAKSNPNKMYWNGYYNSGKGYNNYGSWGSLPDSEWRTNGKYDTCLYEVDITTGEATRLAKIPNRFTFSALWVEGDDSSDGSGVTGIELAKESVSDGNANAPLYNLAGQRVSDSYRGIVIKGGKKFVNQ